MAQTIARTIRDSGVLIAEAGTGTGKTFAYLVPALLLGGKVVVSTGTKNLQDQLFLRDLPAVRHALNAPVTVALLKGRANYVCHYRLQKAVAEGRMRSREEVSQVRSIERFAKVTTSGDKSGLADVPENAPVWSLVTSTRDNCLGSECSFYKECFVMKARREAQAADVVVVNHHLFFADLALRDEGVAELLPAANTIVFDEAHQLPEVATAFFGESVSTHQLVELGRDAAAVGLAHAADAGDWREPAGALEKAARDLRLVFGPEAAKLPAQAAEARDGFGAALQTLDDALQALIRFAAPQAPRHPELEAILRRCTDLAERLTDWSADDPERVRWVDIFAQSVQLNRTPLSVAEPFAAQRAGRPQAWILTSATLSVKNDFSHFADRLGLGEAASATWNSPFDYAAQGLLYVPASMPEPFSPQYLDAVVDAAWPLVLEAGGGVFFLCTTLRAVDRLAERLAAQVSDAKLDMPVFKQGSGTRNELLERFRRHGRALLVGSQSFWEGVDVPGEALSMVVIDRLPFAPPDDPVLAARLAALQKAGANPFMDYQVPEAAITLKQGAGRLIRSESDRGLLMICDPRLTDKPYGRRLWQCLPPFKRTRELEEALRFLEEKEKALQATRAATSGSSAA
jgi:ATP-dependent DNA helicase DinG